MSKQVVKDTIGWGITLWLFGYILGIMLFMLVPRAMIGWIVMPIGVVIALWILWKKIKSNSLNYYLLLAVSWTLIAVVLDYVFIVKMLKPVGGYYKIDVYLYYILTFLLPMVIGWSKFRKNR